MICEEIAVLISSCTRLSPPVAVTNNVVKPGVHRSVMLYHIVRFRAPPVAIVRAVKDRVDGALEAHEAWQRARDHDCPCHTGESFGRRRNVHQNRRFNRKVEAAFLQKLPNNATMLYCERCRPSARRMCVIASEWTRRRHGLQQPAFD